MTGDGAKPTPPSLGAYLLHHVLKVDGVENVSYHGFTNKMQVTFRSGRAKTFEVPYAASAAVTAFSSATVQAAILRVKRHVMDLKEGNMTTTTEEEKLTHAEEDQVEAWTAQAVHHLANRKVSGGIQWDTAQNFVRLGLDDGSDVLVYVHQTTGKLSAKHFPKETLEAVMADLKKRVEELEKQMTPEQREGTMEKGT